MNQKNRQQKAVPPIRWVKSPLDKGMLRPLEANSRFVQFRSRLTDADFETLGRWLADYPHAVLRAFGSYDRSITDLDFLRFFPSVTRFSADALYDSLQSIEGLAHLSEQTTELRLGKTKKRLSLKPLARFTNLRSLSIEGHTLDLDTISGLGSLEVLTLRDITLPDLSLLLPLTRLRALKLKGGATQNLELLPQIGVLDSFELSRIDGSVDLAPVGRMPHLERLLLDALKRVDTLPDFSGAPRLESVWIEGPPEEEPDLARRTESVGSKELPEALDLSPLLTAPALRLLAVKRTRNQPEDFRPLTQHPTLERIIIDIGTADGNARAAKVLPLPVAERWSWNPLADDHAV